MKSSDANLKGRFLETLIAFLYEVSGHNVERNGRLPSVDRSGREREFDVLLRIEPEELAGCPVYIPIECRNYGKRIGVDQIDAFVGKMWDVGIDTRLGVFVAASGYTSGAIKRAEAEGIKTLVAEGLTSDRLALEFKRVLQSLVFWVAEWKDTSCFPFSLPGEGPDGSIPVSLPPGVSWKTGSLDRIWRLWVQGDIPCEIGEHMVTVRYEVHQRAIWTIEVSAHGACFPGGIKTATLADAGTGELEKRYLGVDLHLGSGAAQLVRYADAEELEKEISRPTSHLALRTPRIIGPQMYWPPSEQTASRVAKLLATNQAVLFDRVEGPNILRAWTIPPATGVRRDRQ